MTNSETKFMKLSIALRYYLQGAKYFNALKAYNFAEKFHNGTRKDGFTKEIQHQIEIAHYARTLPVLPKNAEDIYTIIFLHDIMEDKDISSEELEAKFGENVAICVKILSKCERDYPKTLDNELYYINIGNNPFTAIIKGCDRIHNLSSMVGVFTNEKQKTYISETKYFVLPMLKYARRNFPDFELTFENIKFNIQNQLKIVEHFLNKNE